MNASALLDLLATHGIEPWIAVTGGALLALLAILAFAQMLARRRMHAVMSALNDSARGRLLAMTKPSAIHEVVAFDPAPAPFADLTADFSMGGGLPLGALWALLFRRQMLVFFAELHAAPKAELMWQSHQLPSLARGRMAETELWVQRTLADGTGAFATRGENTAALAHTFNDMQSRFGPFLRVVTITAEEPPHVVVMLAASRLNCEEIPALVKALCRLGRAAQVR